MQSLLKNNDAVYKALAMVAIEKALLDSGKQAYDKVIDMLKQEYNCYLADCYEHPEYLNAVLKKLFGNSYFVILRSINEQLKEFSYKEPIERLVWAV